MDISLSQVDFNEPGELPPFIKVILFAALCGLIWGAGYYFIIKDKQLNLESLEQKEVTLKQSFENKQAKAVNLEAYKAQLAEMKVMFASMLEQLPKKREIPDLLIDVTRTGLVNGLEFLPFQPQGERRVDFYSELPIKMQVSGDYHQLGDFVSGIASLPRIVTMHDFSIKPSSGNEMIMDLTAKTYRYFDGE
jgi:type IV pilus assembly protein PilO